MVLENSKTKHVLSKSGEYSECENRIRHQCFMPRGHTTARKARCVQVFHADWTSFKRAFLLALHQMDWEGKYASNMSSSKDFCKKLWRTPKLCNDTNNPALSSDHRQKRDCCAVSHLLIQVQRVTVIAGHRKRSPYRKFEVKSKNSIYKPLFLLS